MIRYSSYGMTNFQRTPVQTIDDPLQTEYAALLELRERVTRAEAAAQRRAKTKPPARRPAAAGLKHSSRSRARTVTWR